MRAASILDTIGNTPHYPYQPAVSARDTRSGSNRNARIRADRSRIASHCR